MSATSTITDNAINHDHDGCRASITQPTVRLPICEQHPSQKSHFASGNRLFDCAQPAAVKTLSFQHFFSKNAIFVKTSIFAFKNALLETHFLRETLLFHSCFSRFFNVFFPRNNNALSTPSFSLHTPSAHLRLPPKLYYEQPSTEQPSNVAITV